MDEPSYLRRRAVALSAVGVAAFLAWQALAVRAFSAQASVPLWDAGARLPPLLSWQLGLVVSSPSPATAALWVNFAALALLCAALLALALYFRPDGSAAACVLLVAAAPAVQTALYSGAATLSAPALIATVYALLVYSEELRSWPFSLAFGAAAAACMLDHWISPLFLLPAFFAWLRATSRHYSRWQAFAAAGLAVAGSVPWYSTHGLRLAFELWTAPASGSALRDFLGAWPEALGPFFWAFALIGVVVPQYHRAGGQGWLMGGWFLASTVFWCALPVRSIRLWLGAIPALGIAGTGAWPTGLLWGLAAVQLLGAANMNQGWIAPIRVPVPYVDLTFFPAGPGGAASWPFEQVLRAATQLHDPAHPFVTVSVAGTPGLEPLHLRWTAERLGLSQVTVRGRGRVDLAEFIVAQEGALSAQLQTVYSEAARWPAPGGRQLVLYRQRLPARAPVAEPRIDIQYYTGERWEAEDARLDLEGFDAKRGVYRLVRLQAKELQIRGLAMSRLKVELEDAVFLPIEGKDRAWDDVVILRAGKVRLLGLSLDADALARLLESLIPGLAVGKASFEEGRLRLVGRYHGMSVDVATRLSLESGGLRAKVERAQVGPIRVSESALKGLGDFFAPWAPQPRRPIALEVPSLTLDGSWLTVP